MVCPVMKRGNMMWKCWFSYFLSPTRLMRCALPKSFKIRCDNKPSDSSSIIEFRSENIKIIKSKLLDKPNRRRRDKAVWITKEISQILLNLVSLKLIVHNVTKLISLYDNRMYITNTKNATYYRIQDDATEMPKIGI